MNHTTILKALLLCCIANPLLLQAKIPPRLNTGNVAGFFATMGSDVVAFMLALDHWKEREYTSSLFVGGIACLMGYANGLVVDDIMNTPKPLKKNHNKRS